ncbi:MAG TPA: hypothetical protein VFV02_03735 [Acidimicrobiales bacterium]|nr:hypothetical protein [Acidimicrobiales bacterium]
MDPEGTSRDDLDVRLHWPGTEPEAAADRQRRAKRNGASPARQEPTAPTPSAPVHPERRVSVPAEVEFDAVRATLALISARLDSLGSAVETARLPYNSSLDAALERLEHAVTVLTRMVTEAEDRSARSLHEVLQRTEESAEQLEALRRRVALRARAEQLSPETIDKVAEAVAARLSEPQSRRRPRHT